MLKGISNSISATLSKIYTPIAAAYGAYEVYKGTA